MPAIFLIIMTRQEFLAMSLPFNLKCDMQSNGVVYHQVFYKPKEYEIEFIYEKKISWPILRPLSELKEIIEHNDEKFNPIDRYLEFFYIQNLKFEIDRILLQNESEILNLPLSFLLKLVEWNFDIAGLIKKRQAIDYRTIPGFFF